MIEYKDMTLIALGIAGILLHNLVKIYDLKKKGTKFSFPAYWEMEWPAMIISLIVVFIADVVKHEIKSLEGVGNLLGLGFVALGYMAQSILITFMGKAGAKIGIKED